MTLFLPPQTCCSTSSCSHVTGPRTPPVVEPPLPVPLPLLVQLPLELPLTVNKLYNKYITSSLSFLCTQIRQWYNYRRVFPCNIAQYCTINRPNFIKHRGKNAILNKKWIIKWTNFELSTILYSLITITMKHSPAVKGLDLKVFGKVFFSRYIM